MIWGADFDTEDYGYEPGGIVSTFSCTGCSATAEFTIMPDTPYAEDEGKPLVEVFKEENKNDKKGGR